MPPRWSSPPRRPRGRDAGEAGREFKAGETAAKIEALKMQNILKAERDGAVKAVSAGAGDPGGGHVLVEFG